MTPYLLAFALAQALDAGSSCVGFARGATEANPFMPGHCTTMVAIKGVSTAVYALAMHPLTRRRPKVAKALTVALTGATMAIAWHNTTIGGK